jgi:hypothetical protein
MTELDDRTVHLAAEAARIVWQRTGSWTQAVTAAFAVEGERVREENARLAAVLERVRTMASNADQYACNPNSCAYDLASDVYAVASGQIAPGAATGSTTHAAARLGLGSRRGPTQRRGVERGRG